jgi:hypothetical protein
MPNPERWHKESIKSGAGFLYAILMRGGLVLHGSLTPFRRIFSSGPMEDLAMADLVYLCIGLAFFAVVGGYALLCDRL